MSLLKINESSFQFWIECMLYLSFFKKTLNLRPNNLDLSTTDARSLVHSMIMLWVTQL